MLALNVLPQGFGVEVSGFDVHNGRDAADIASLKEAYDQNGLIIFRNDRQVAPERQVEICSWFGPVLPNDVNGENWGFLRNDEISGSIVLPYHCDMSYLEHPILGISLHAISLPEVACPTAFISNAVAWDSLPEDLRRQVGSLTLRHFFSGYRYEGWPDFEALHPVCLRHPKSGRELLFVTAQHASRLVEVDAERSDELISRLLAHIYRPEFEYEHRWQKWDLLVWDNLALQHARVRVSDRSAGSRVLQRVMLGQFSFSDQFEVAKQRHLDKGLSLARGSSGPQ